MCGFLAQYNVEEPVDAAALESLLALSHRRGPDDTQSLLLNPRTWFGFNRLAIQDLSEAGRQPMSSKDGDVTIVFNGEVYNHMELRRELGRVAWNGHSDTETVVECISAWGFESTVEKLDGMFAIVCHVKSRNTLYGARDFAGIKPFFYGWDGRRFVAASQYNQVSKHPAYCGKCVDRAVLRLYLEQHFMPAPFGLREDTAQLEPGQILKIQNGRMTKTRYWDLPRFVEPNVTSIEEAVERMSGELQLAVEAEMISDVPLGSFLSGGIDSPLVTACARRRDPDLKTFTIGSDSNVHDESETAATYSKLIGTRHVSLRLDAAYIKDRFDRIMECMTEPMADFSVIPTFLVSELARKQVTVALSGDGGDELFFGYERFWSVAKNIRFQHWPWVFKAALYKADKWTTGNRRLNGGLLSSSQSTAHRSQHSRFPKQWLEALFPDLKGVETPAAYSNYGYSNTGDEGGLIQVMRRAEFYGMMQKTLRKVDLASMGNSLEVRVPFLKKSFIEASLQIDPFLSYGPKRKKELLKTMLRRWLPEAPIDNVKKGFSVPLGAWFREGRFLSDAFEGRSRVLDETFGIDAASLGRLQSAHLKGEQDLKWPLFTLISLVHD